MLSILNKIFGTKSQRDIKKLVGTVTEINKLYESFHNISNEELREKVKALKEKIKNDSKNIVQKIESLEKRLEKTNDDIVSMLTQKEELTNLKRDLDKITEESLNLILPEAFAIIKETCKRFSENSEIVVTAEDFDIKLSGNKEYVKISNDKAIWKNSWIANGSEVKWTMIPYDVQIIGGIVLHQGKIAEMATGEGKTLTSVMPIFLNALAGKGVHVITVNDYLSKRDSEWNAPIFQFYGLSVDCIDKHQSNSDERRQAYNSDITYGTNNEFGFDYLRDNMAKDINEAVQKKLHFAIVDEVDSVLIDDARTPLIISGPMEESNEKEYQELKPVIENLVREQYQIVTDFFRDAKEKIASGDKEKGGVSLFRVYRGLPKYKPFIKYLNEKGINSILYNTENYYLQENSKMMPEADEPLMFTIEEKNNLVEFTDNGIAFISKYNKDPSFFVLPDISLEIAEIQNSQVLSDEEKEKKEKEIIVDFKKKSQRLHVTKQLLKAYTLFEINDDYIIDNKKVKIIDEQTGRILSGRRYSDGLHQALEAKENVDIKPLSQTYATITLQNYFRMYHKLSGMTGTAITEAGEFWDIYKLDVVEIPTNKPVTRIDKDDMVYKTVREKFNAVIEEIKSLTDQNRPVLVGTTSVENSEIISRLLKLKGIKHQVLNAKYHDVEAEIIANAGVEKTVTIATNMAGRGTDIKLTEKSKASGGLAIVGTERHESRRVDRQLRGRSGRQGDVGTSQFFLALEDPLMRLFGSDRLIVFFDKIGMEEGEVIQHSMVTNSIEKAQKKVEEGNFATRKRLLEYDNVMSSQRTIIYEIRKNCLEEKNINVEIFSMIHYMISHLYENYSSNKNSKIFSQNMNHLFGDLNFSVDDFIKNSKNKSPSVNDIYQKIIENLNLIKIKRKNLITEAIKDIKAGEAITLKLKNDELLFKTNLYEFADTDIEEAFNQLIRKITLESIDSLWKHHLKNMDNLRQEVQNVVYEKKDPILMYKIEAYNLFKVFLENLYSKILTIIFIGQLEIIKIPYLIDKNPDSSLLNMHGDVGNTEIDSIKKQILEILNS